ASSWLLNLPNESLAFILADEGFDVWLANTRGTEHSQGHTSLNPNDPAYWDWSWDELAACDLPAFFQYVNGHTGKKLHYVGHSLGTLMALAALSQGKLLDMLRSAALLCPVAFMGQVPTPLVKAAADSFIAEDLYWLGVHEFLPGGDAAATLVDDICQKTHSNCSSLMTALTGNSCCVNSSRIDILLKHEPQPTSTKNMIHLAQMIRKGTIMMYDYGSIDQNKKHYGQPTPPAYNMGSIPNNVPLFLGYGGQDMLADVKDVHTLLDALKSHDADKLVLLYQQDYAHADFVFGINAKQVVYDHLMAFFNIQ
ncbi:Triacylglycerol lipase, partial [Bertholletia excelsa]